MGPVSHPRLFLPFGDMCRAYGSHGLPRGATPLVQRHFLLRLGRRRVTYPRTRVAPSCSSPGTVRYPAGASHLQVRQQHRLILPCVVPPTLIACSACWLLELLDASGAYEYPEYLDLRLARTILALTSMPATPGSTAPWAPIPVALHVSTQRAPTGTGHKTEIRVLGFINGYGAPFAGLWPLILAPVWLAAQPNAQITPALATAALLAHLELMDAARDARSPGDLFGRHCSRPRTSTTGLAGNRSWARAGDSRGDDGRGGSARTLGAARVFRERAPSSSREFAVEGGVRAYVQGFLPALTPVRDPEHIRPHGPHCTRPVARWNMESRPARGNA